MQNSQYAEFLICRIPYMQIIWSAYKEWYKEHRKYCKDMLKHRQIRQRNIDLRSQRFSALLKLNQAAQFENFKQIYFPYKVDF